jgi:putative iron-dependent peroxidase
VDAIAQLQAWPFPEHLIGGLGSAFLASLGATIPGLRPMPAFQGAVVSTPATPSDLWLRVAGADPGQVMHRERALLAQLPAFEVVDRVAAFVHGNNQDLSGYEDGTENPTGDRAHQVVFGAERAPGLAGSAVVAIQSWVHDMGAFDAMGKQQQDHTIGRERISNEELDEAPESAHVKRTAQEDFEPEAFVVRRSMPWRDSRGAGLIFVSFSETLDPFQAQLRRMVGLDDGIVDGLYSFTRPVTGATFWCPPLRKGSLDLRALLP